MCGKFFYILLFSIISIIEGNELDSNSLLNELKTGKYNLFKKMYDLQNIGSEACTKALRLLHTQKYHKYLVQMYDASDFTPSGIFYSQGTDFGNYDECIDIDFTDDGTRILGKHCAPGLGITTAIYAYVFNVSLESFGLTPLSGVAMSLCMPDACWPSDFREKFGIPKDFPYIQFPDEICTTKETGQEYTTGDILFITLLGFIAFLMICSTSYDVYNYLHKKESRHPLLISFSVFTNGRKLLNVSKGSKEQIQLFHGLKFISMMWIVAGHGFVGWLDASAFNRPDIQNLQKEQYFQYISAAPLSVDTFFYLSGFLLAYQYLKPEKPKPLQKQISQIPFMYLHRYIRLTPALAMVYFLTITIMPHLGSGPRYYVTSQVFSTTCKNQWWSFFLYIQNYHNPADICMTQTWYLSADMQMFVFSPILLIPLSLHIRKSFKKCMIALIIINIFFTFLPLVIQLNDEAYAQYNGLDTHSRIINYTIGITMGAYIRINFDKVFRIKMRTNLIIWTIILVEMWATIMLYQYFKAKGIFTHQIIFSAFMRPAWCIGLSWIVFSSFHGYGGFINWLLSLPACQVGSRLSYCIYLIHGSIIVNFLSQVRTKRHFGNYQEYMLWCGYFMTSVIFSFIWTLAFESPFITIGKSIINVLSKPFQGK